MLLPIGLLVALGLLIVLVVVRDARAGRVELLSTRNLFLLGFIIFQVNSPIVTLAMTGYMDLRLQDKFSSGLIFAGVAWAFLLLFLWAYRRAGPAVVLSRVSPLPQRVLSNNGLLALSVVTLGVGVFFRLGLGHLPLIAVLGVAMGAGLLALAAGLAWWAAAQQRLNPLFLLVAVGVTGVAGFATIQGSIGRREVLGVLLAAIWGGYFSAARFMSPTRLRLLLASIGIAGFVFMSGYSVARHVHAYEKSLSQTVQAMQDADYGAGLARMAGGQNAGECSMWLIETRPDLFPYDPLHSLRYLLFHPVPRAMWPNKPNALGALIPEQIQRQAYVNFGPGLVGHIWNDVIWIALPLYGLLFAWFYRYLDECRRNAEGSAMFVVTMGSTLGQIMGTPRGEIGLFVFLTIAGIVACWIYSLVISMLLPRPAVYVDDAYHDADDEDEAPDGYPEAA